MDGRHIITVIGSVDSFNSAVLKFAIFMNAATCLKSVVYFPLMSPSSDKMTIKRYLNLTDGIQEILIGQIKVSGDCQSFTITNLYAYVWPLPNWLSVVQKGEDYYLMVDPSSLDRLGNHIVYIKAVIDPTEIFGSVEIDLTIFDGSGCVIENGPVQSD